MLFGNQSNALTCLVYLVTCMRSMAPVDSMRDASFTVFPQMSYTGLRAPITPPTRGPQLIPVDIAFNVKKHYTARLIMYQSYPQVHKNAHKNCTEFNRPL